MSEQYQKSIRSGHPLEKIMQFHCGLPPATSPAAITVYLTTSLSACSAAPNTVAISVLPIVIDTNAASN